MNSFLPTMLLIADRKPPHRVKRDSLNASILGGSDCLLRAFFYDSFLIC